MKQVIYTARILLTKALKRLLSPVHFRGKGTLLSALCPKAGEIPLSLFGYAFDCDLSDHIQRNIFLFDYDENAQRFIRKNLKAGDTFLDVGANVGFYSLLAASIVGETGKVVSVEPNPKTFARLQAAVLRNHLQNIVLLNTALGKERGTLYLYFHPGSGNDSPTMVAHDAPESVKVDIVPLDEVALAHQLKTIHYLKIDVEGFEPEVFAGAKTLLAGRKINAIQSEFNDYWLRENGSSPDKLHHFLTEAGFKDIEGTPAFVKGGIVDRFFIQR